MAPENAELLVFCKKKGSVLLKKYKLLMVLNRRLLIIITFAAAKEKLHYILGYGVMVTLQILVLSFLVRARVPQPKVLSIFR